MTHAAYSSTALRKSTWHFLTGKVASALLTFFILLWVVRLLPIDEYGAYVTFIAGIELALAIAALGLPWMAARYLPEYRLHADKSKLVAFMARILIWQTAAITLLALLLFVALDAYLAWVNLSNHKDVAQLFVVILIFEGISRTTRDNLLGPMLLQGYAQISLVGRSVIYILLLAEAVFNARPPSLLMIGYIEIIATGIGMTIALTGLYLNIRALPGANSSPLWEEPKIMQMWRTAINMYLSHMMSMLHSPQIFLIITQKYLGNEAVALLGFIRSLYDLISRYLPATMLFSVVRPKLVSSFVGGGGVKELSRNANMVGKLSLFVLTPILVFSMVSGEKLIAFASGAKFLDSGFYFFGLLLALIPYSQRQLLETVAVTTGNSATCMRASISGPLTLPILFLLIYLGFGLWAPIIALGIGYTIFNTIIALAMNKLGYQTDILGAAKLGIIGILTYSTTFWSTHVVSGFGGLVLSAIAVALVYFAIAFAFKPFTEDERNTINRFAKRRVFIW
jgi:O-antigen/teichoic acid export membrane protein